MGKGRKTHMSFFKIIKLKGQEIVLSLVNCCQIFHLTLEVHIHSSPSFALLSFFEE